MNNEQIKKLALDLYAADKEEVVVRILEKNKLWDRSKWQILGGDRQATSIANAQQDNPVGALVEKIINSIDAVLTKECLKRDIDPTSKEAPQTMRDAQIDYFNIYDGNLSNITPSERNKLSQNIHLVASGYKSKNPCLAIIDKGEGQEPEEFSKTLLSLNQSLKQKVQFVQGKHGMGGTGVISYCSEKHRFQLIISKKNNEIASRSSDEWGVTVIRRFSAEGNERISTLRYLAPDNNILSFKADELNVIPKLNKGSYDLLPLDSGTIVKLYDYNFSSERFPGRARGRLTRHIQDRLSTKLPGAALPFFLSDLRYPEETQRVFAPLQVRLDSDTAKELIEHEFTSTIMVKDQKFPCRILLFKKNLAKGDDQGKRTYARDYEGVLFTLNGQTHGDLQETFFTEIGYKDLKESLLVLIDCTKVSINMKEELFMSSRDRLKKTETTTDFIQNKLIPVLKDDPTLKEALNRRIKEKNEHLINSSKTIESVIQKIINSNPTLTRLFIKGEKISSPLKQRMTGVINKPFVGKRFPTFFKLKDKHEINKPRDAELKRKIRISYETDVQNDYFERDSDKGSFDFFINDEIASLDSFSISNGIAVLSLQINESFQLGETYKLTTKVTDVSRPTPFEESLWINIIPFKKNSNSTPKPRPPKPNPDEPGTRTTPEGHAIPTVYEVNSSQWERHNMDENSALKADYNGSENGWTFYVNADNKYLIHYSNSNKRKSIQVLRKKYGAALLLMGISIIEDELESDASNNGEVSEKIEGFSKNISMVLMSIIDEIGKENSSVFDEFEIEKIEDFEDA
ncbi:MAG: hypothetical protein HN564_04530 [Flavobacteriales bacterium]|nr:hypothetical protein [Flavobacteriales bacterium]